MDAGVAIAVISLLGTIVAAYMSQDKLSKKDAVELEKRLSSIENAIRYKLDPLWAVIEREIPKILVRADTPKLDALLFKLGNNGFDNTATADLEETLCLVSDQIVMLNMGEHENLRMRAFALVFLKAAVDSVLDQRKHSAIRVVVR